MYTYQATKTTGWRILIGGAMALLVLAIVGLPDSRAQMRYSGGFVPYHRHPPNVTPFAPPAWPPEPPSFYPDSDAYFPSYVSAAPAVRRSYYSAEADRLPATPIVPAAVLPWNKVGFKGYNERPELVRDTSLFPPQKYALEATPLSLETPTGQAERALLIAHLPENALLWVEGKLTPLNGPTHPFRSPPLAPDKKFTYTVRVVWIEEGRWVSQTAKVPVRAGLIQTLYLRAL